MRSILLALLTLSCLGPTIASAQDPNQDQSRDQSRDVENARRHYEAGRSYYEQLRYDDAAREFEEAYRLSSRSHLLKNVAMSYQHGQRWQEAADAFERYLAETPEVEDREEIERRVLRLRELADQDAAEDPELGEANADRDLEAGGDARPAEAPREDDQQGGFPTAFVVTGSIGAALGVGALITGLMSNSIYQDLDQSCPMGVCSPDREDDKDRGQTLATVSTILTVAAGAAAIAAIVLFFTVDRADRSEERDQAEASVALAAGPGDVGASMELSF